MNRSPHLPLEVVALATAAVSTVNLAMDRNVSVDTPARHGGGDTASMAPTHDESREVVHSVEVIAWVATCWVLPCDVTTA
ncbi:MAG: hypothetical protein JNK85_15195 [Verrucomicrobiales bacterium]|nr:hypothetical protein [Verrucomicrobiales bacterium]